MAYATWNPADKHANITLTSGSLVATATADGWKSVRSTIGKSSGKWYWEVTMDAINDIMVDVGLASVPVSSYAGNDSDGYGYYNTDGNKYNSGANVAYGATYTTDIIGVALDMDNGKVWWSKNGSWQASGDPGAGTNEAYSGLTGTMYAMLSIYTNTNKTTANFGASAFTYSVPTGFTAGLSDFTGYFSGYVYEEGSPVSRTMYLYTRGAGTYITTTTSSGDGYYYMETTNSGSHFIVCLDDDAGTDYNDLIVGDVYPTTVSG